MVELLDLGWDSGDSADLSKSLTESSVGGFDWIIQSVCQ
ncbi:Protein of unknown function [Bacillus mobilis]|nr:Protein of unknown function [Bacillus mobilis]